VEQGTPSSLLRVLDLILLRGLESSDFGRVMTAVTVTLLQKLYPGAQNKLPPIDPPPSHGYTRILQNVGTGLYTLPPVNSADYLECVLPFLALLGETREEILLQSAPALWRGRQINPGSPLAPYFLGIVLEHTGSRAAAEDEYFLASILSPDCYPAVLALARIKRESGKTQEALNILSNLAVRNPDNFAVKRALALAYYEARDWPLAESVIDEILQQNNRDGEFILLRAYVMIEQGQILQAQAPLDLYTAGDSTTANPVYLYLRARVLAEGYRNREQALSYLQEALRASPDDEEIAVYTAKFLIGSSLIEEQIEGRRILRNLLNKENPSLWVLGLAVEDAIRREAWREAQAYLERIPPEFRSTQDLLNAYRVERGLGNNAAALSYARELYRRDPVNEEGTMAYISALIDTARQDEAARMIEARLASLPGGSIKSHYYFQRSRLRHDEDAVITDLRSSLFEDPRNLNALIAMFEIYHRRRDERRAAYYLEQALVLSPDNPRLRRYKAEY
jgi:tetratricopeptide (TPR) repeat protein